MAGLRRRGSPTLDDADMERLADGVSYWRSLAHVVNHGTQHRSEAAALLTSAGSSPAIST